MTKAELVEALHGGAGKDLTKKAVGELVDATFEEIKKSLKKGQRFSFPGFGTFTQRKRKPRVGRNPKTGQTIKIPASKTVGFKPAPDFKKSL